MDTVTGVIRIFRDVVARVADPGNNFTHLAQWQQPNRTIFLGQLFKQVIEFIGAGLAAAEPVAAGIVAALRPLLDVSRSNAAVIDEYAITQGDGPVFCVLTLRRYRTMDRATFMEAWFGRHAKLGEKVEGVRYRQNHAELAASAALAARLGLAGTELDGMALSYFDGPREAAKILGAPAVAVGAIEDERRFIDHPRSQFSLYRTIGFRSAGT